MLSSSDYSPLLANVPVWIPRISWPILAASGKLRAVSVLADHRMATFGMKHAVSKRKKSDVEIEPYKLTPYYLLYGNWKHIIGPLSKVQSSL